MKKLILILLATSLLFSCKSEKKKRNKNLLGFKISFIDELGAENYDFLKNKVDQDPIETKYINDIIYVSYYQELNACGKYDGNIEISNDTIKLQTILISNEVCTSLSIEKITFLIDNPDEKKKIIIKE